MNSKEENEQLAEYIPVVPNTNLILALKQLNLERVRAEVELQKEIFELELKHQDKFKKFDEKRRLIVNGDYVPTDDECYFEFADPKAEVVKSEEKGIPKFWLQMMSNLDTINDMITERDAELLGHLTDIRCVLLSQPKGYRLEFEFSENKYFTNKVLTKEYYFSDSFDPEDPFGFDALFVNRCKGCKIDWKSPELNLTQEKITKKMKHRNSQQVKTVDKVQKCDSFFNFFDEEDGCMEVADDDTKEILAADFDIGELFRLNILPRAVLYYTGEGITEDFSEDEEMDEFDEEDYDEDDADDDDDDEEEEDDDEDDDGKDSKPKFAKSKNMKSQNGKK